MNTDNHIVEKVAPEPNTSAELVTHDPITTESGSISFKINRQTLVVSALTLLLAISVFETIELTRLHQALKTWQTLPAAPAPAAGGNALPAQVGGC